jgi:hypothetical protein
MHAGAYALLVLAPAILGQGLKGLLRLPLHLNDSPPSRSPNGHFVWHIIARDGLRCCCGPRRNRLKTRRPATDLPHTPPISVPVPCSLPRQDSAPETARSKPPHPNDT